MDSITSGNGGYTIYARADTNTVPVVWADTFLDCSRLPHFHNSSATIPTAAPTATGTKLLKLIWCWTVNIFMLVFIRFNSAQALKT